MRESTINERIKSLITTLKLTPNAFASKLGMRSTAIYNILNGKNKPSYDLLENIIAIFNVSPSWLFTSEGNIFKDLNAVTMDKSETNREFIAALENAESPSESVKRYAIGYFSDERTEKLLSHLPENHIMNIFIDSFNRLKDLYENYSMLVDLLQSFNAPAFLIEKFQPLNYNDFYCKFQSETSPKLKKYNSRKDGLIDKCIYLMQEMKRMEFKFNNLILNISLNKDVFKIKDTTNM